jgi:predicted nuclease with TOPRIM domain
MKIVEAREKLESMDKEVEQKINEFRTLQSRIHACEDKILELKIAVSGRENSQLRLMTFLDEKMKFTADEYEYTCRIVDDVIEYAILATRLEEEIVDF